jgi:uroporphyrinogen-III synthase
VLLVTSGSTARGFAALATGPNREKILATPVIAAGARAARAAVEAGFRTIVTAPAPDATALATFTAQALGVAPAGLATASRETR